MRSSQMDMSSLNQPARLGTSNRRRRSLLVCPLRNSWQSAAPIERTYSPSPDDQVTTLDQGAH